ncbi:hypothetical protein Tsubulata_018858 [Turnera subulata]|uniref:DUF4283 domain-containing protein n=1 Tax=Turnera subulata TaxID=218843 RepID=A0A9Q0FNT0_9ROSI|nr:hypothetical protein Tsubulata_018858 [Turnera subulata]
MSATIPTATADGRSTKKTRNLDGGVLDPVEEEGSLPASSQQEASGEDLVVADGGSDVVMVEMQTAAGGDSDVVMTESQMVARGGSAAGMKGNQEPLLSGDTTRNLGEQTRPTRTVVGAAVTRPSFHDILYEQRSGGESSSPVLEDEPEVECNDGDITYIRGKYGMAVKLSESFKERLEKCWDYTVVVKLLGRTVGYRTLCGRLQTLWKPSRSMKVPWDSSFRASDGRVSQAVIWARFVDFPPCWYNSEVLRTLGNLVGGSMKVDANTKEAIRGKYARVAVEVDLSKPLRRTVEFDDRDFKVSYEGIPTVCYGCGSMTHSLASCPSQRGPDLGTVGSSPTPHTRAGPSFTVSGAAEAQQAEETVVTIEKGKSIAMKSPPRSGAGKRTRGEGAGPSQPPVQEGRDVGLLPQPSDTVAYATSVAPVSAPGISIVPQRSASSRHTVTTLHPQSSSQVLSPVCETPIVTPETFAAPPPAYGLTPQPTVLLRPSSPHTRAPDLNLAGRTKTPDRENKKAPIALPLKKPPLKVFASRKLSLGGDGTPETRSKAATRGISRGDFGVIQFTAVYGSPQPAIRQYLWENLCAIAPRVVHPWCVAGDFNAILSASEIHGTTTSVRRGCQQFQRCVDQCCLEDLGFQGSSFTWHWGLVFHLPTLFSDHCPLLIDLGLHIGSHQLGGSQFKFQAAWTSHPDFVSFISSHWASDSSVLDALASLVGELIAWNADVFGNIVKRKRVLLKRLAGIQRYLSLRHSLFLSSLEVDLRREYSEVLAQEELLWFQKSRCQWINDGDRNTAFYHARTVVRRRHSFVAALRDEDGRWCTDQQQLQDLAVRFYTKLFAETDMAPPPFPLSGCFPRLAEEVAGGLGLRRLEAQNRALLAKLGWGLVSSPSSLWEGRKKERKGFPLASEGVVSIDRLIFSSEAKKMELLVLCSILCNPYDIKSRYHLTQDFLEKLAEKHRRDILSQYLGADVTFTSNNLSPDPKEDNVFDSVKELVATFEWWELGGPCG